MENNSRNPSDLVRKTGIVTAKKKVQLTLSLGKKKKGDEVEDDDDGGV